jgi:hypothetical protein
MLRCRSRSQPLAHYRTQTYPGRYYLHVSTLRFGCLWSSSFPPYLSLCNHKPAIRANAQIVFAQAPGAITMSAVADHLRAEQLAAGRDSAHGFLTWFLWIDLVNHDTTGGG